MAARISWLLFGLAGITTGLCSMASAVNRPRANHVFVIVLMAICVILSLLVSLQMAIKLIRFLRHPLQKKQQYSVSGQPLQQFLIAPLLIEGPCLLVLNSDLEMVGATIDHIDSSRLPKFRRSGYPHIGLDFRIPAGKWPLRMMIQLSGHLFRSFRLGIRHEGKSFSATLTLEVRGQPRFNQLPESVQEMTRAFPVLSAAPAQS
jgi:hypothetical protein